MLELLRLDGGLKLVALHLGDKYPRLKGTDIGSRSFNTMHLEKLKKIHGRDDEHLEKHLLVLA